MAHKQRGFTANKPADIPLLGWWDICKRVYHSMSQDNLSFVAAGVAFYAVLAIVLNNKNTNILLKRMNSAIFTHGCLILMCLNNTI